MQPHRHIERRPGGPRLPWHAPPDEQTSSRPTNAYARTRRAERHTANPYDNGYRAHSEAMPEAERERSRDQHAAALAAEVERLERQRVENPRRGAISLGSSGMPPSAPPTFPPAGFTPGSPAAVLEAERNRVRRQRRAAISSGSLVIPPPPPPSYSSPGGATVNPAALSGAAEPSISGRNRLRSESHPWGPPPPPRPASGFSSFDGASSQGTANLHNDDDRTRPATFQEALDRNRARNPEPYTRGSRPSTALLSDFPLSNERPSRGTTDPTHGSLSAAVQEAVDYNNDLAARGTGSRPRHPPLLSATEQAPPPSARDRQLEIMNRAVQPRNRARNGDISRSHQDASVAHPNYEADAMTRSRTRRGALPAGYDFLSYDFFHAMPPAEQRASYLQLSNEKIESFVHGLPVHVILDLPADKQDCAICMEKYYGLHQRETPVRLPCNHVLGKECLLTWLKSPATNRNNNCCPVCRTVLLERVPIFPPPTDDFPDNISDLSDHYEEHFTDRSAALDEDTQLRQDLQREMTAMVRNLDNIRRTVERNEHERTMTGPEGDNEHARWFREREEDHQIVLARLRREHAERMEMAQGMRGERRRRRTGS